MNQFLPLLAANVDGADPVLTGVLLCAVLVLGVVCGVQYCSIRKLKRSRTRQRDQLQEKAAAAAADRDTAQKPEKAAPLPQEDPPLQEQQILERMEYALEHGEFRFYLQPTVDQFTQQILSAEALVRWVWPDRGVLSPKVFIPVLEKSGFISRLDRYIFEQVCIFQHDRLEKKRKTVPIAVNLSREDMDDSLLDFLSGLMEKYKVPASLIRLEIAASAFGDDIEGLSAIVSRLRQEDFYVGIDNLGGNEVSLDILKNIPSDSLKLDLNTIDAPGAESAHDRQIASSMLRTGHLDGKNVLVASVETQEQADRLKYIGFRNAQGFLYYKPMPVSEFDALLAGGKQGRK